MSDRSNLWMVLDLAWSLGYMIVLPLIIFGLGGRWIDAKTESFPLFFILGLLLAIVSTSVWVAGRMKTLIKAQDEPRNEEKQKVN